MRDPDAMEAERELMLRTLDQVAAAVPGDEWVAGQRVFYLVESGQDERAIAAAPDSVAIIRWDRIGGRPDTLAWLRAPQTRGRIGTSVPVRAPSPFGLRDGWVVARDGSVGIVRATDYHVEWIRPSGPRAIGKAVSYQPVRVTESDKEAFRGVARAAFGDGLPRDPAVVFDAAGWPEFKPPFTGAVHIGPDNRVWVPRTRAQGADPQTYDIFDRHGNLVERMTMPARTMMVAVGQRGIYARRLNDDDLMYLQRYRF
jgi:hypothetical protein